MVTLLKGLIILVGTFLGVYYLILGIKDQTKLRKFVITVIAVFLAVLIISLIEFAWYRF